MARTSAMRRLGKRVYVAACAGDPRALADLRAVAKSLGNYHKKKIRKARRRPKLLLTAGKPSPLDLDPTEIYEFANATILLLLENSDLIGKPRPRKP